MAVKNDISLQTFVVAKENGFACSGRRGSNLPRPILIFVVAKKNGPPATVVVATMSASDSILPARPLRHNKAGLSGITPESPWGCCPGVSIRKPSSL